MNRFYSISDFRNSIDAYCKKDNLGYKNCKEDICNFFSNKDIQTIFSQPYLIISSTDYRLIKSRIINSYYNEGKSGGYRIYYYVNRKTECIYFLEFYPKKGRYGRDNLTNTELKILIKNFNNEKQSNLLLEHDINNSLEIIPAKTI
jgi:mRNA-degrading endonuclease RelE of RelBE toxin-antitoxin system